MAPAITVPRGRRPRAPGVTLHTTTDMPVPDWGVHQNIPVTTPARLLGDMVPVTSRRELEILVDAILAKDLAKRSRIAWRIQELSRQGRETGVLVELLEARTDEAGVPASVLESPFRLVVQGFPGLTFNRRVVAGKERRVDCDLNPLNLIAAWAAVDPRVADQAICGSGSGSTDARRRKTSTTSGSNCTPAPASRRSSASSTARARR